MNQPRRRILVLGASGFVGGWVAQRAAERRDVIAGARNPERLPVGVGADLCGTVAIDLAQPESIRAAIDAAGPDVVVLTAALADIDRCEREPELANAVNYRGPALVAEYCARRGARMLFTSSDAVFDGSRPPYAEADPPTPPSHYGRTKAQAEMAIREALPQAVIVRFSQVLGRAGRAGTNSYVDRLAETLRTGRTVRAATFECRNPIDVATLADVLVTLALRDDLAGVFHVGSSDRMSRYELACALAAALGASPDQIEPQNEPTPGRAPRGRDSFLSCERLRATLGIAPPTWREVVARAVVPPSGADL